MCLRLPRQVLFAWNGFWSSAAHRIQLTDTQKGALEKNLRRAFDTVHNEAVHSPISASEGKDFGDRYWCPKTGALVLR